MSLFSSLQIGNNALIAAQIGLQVTGNNIANANTPGYTRAVAIQTPQATQRQGGLLLGLGVHVEAIVQQTDKFLEERLRGAASDLANGETQEAAHLQLESLIGELGETDLSTSLSNFFSSIHDIANQPESASVRNLAVLQGGTLASDIRRLDSRVREVRSDLNDRVLESATDINRLLERIAELNFQIVATEGGQISKSDAIGLRDQRQLALTELAEIIDIRAVEQENGSVTIFAGGEYLVFEATRRTVEATVATDRGLGAAQLKLVETDAPLSFSSGKLAGLIASRDELLGGFLDKLDHFARTLAFEFNRIHSSGQGLRGHDALVSHANVLDPAAALDRAGLPFTPVTGAFQVQVYDTQTQLPRTTDIFIDLNGLDGDTTLESLAAALDQIDGLTAEVTPARRLSIRAESANLAFAFAGDTSGVLAALGVNTFFTGSSAQDLDVSQLLRDDPTRFAASLSGVDGDAENALALAGFIDRPLESEGGSLADMYDRMMGETTQAAAVSRSIAEGFRVFHSTLEGQQLAVSGVSLDEEAINMISYQRAYQAAARFISSISELLEILVKL